jgi:flagellar hook-associated protein 2
MLEDRISMVEKRLRAQYTALDKQMASLTSLSNYVTQQISALNKRSDS